MILYIHPVVLGTKKYLRYDSHDSSYAWTSSAPANAWVYGDMNVLNSLDVVLKLFGIQNPTIAPASYKRSLSILGVNPRSPVPWHNILPSHKFHDIINAMVRVLSDALYAFDNYEYGETFIRERSLLTGLTRTLVDNEKLMAYLAVENNPTILSILNTFKPGADGYAPNIVYDQSSTATGRLTVSSGPSILTLPKKSRDILKSRYPNGSVIQVDFVSLEPRLARMVSGSIPEDDIYKDISNKLFRNKLDRDQVKLAVLCALYGASARKLASVITEEFNPTRVISSVKEYFSVQDLTFKLKNQVFQKGKILNYFGRELTPSKDVDNVLVNHYIQSSAVDVALLGFSNLVSKFSELNINAMPLFIIHDALVLDVHPDGMEKINEIVNKGINIEPLGNFPIEIDTISTSG